MINKNPDSLRQKAKEYRQKAEYYSELSYHASDNAPGSFITGNSGRTKSQNKKTEQALNRTIELSKKALYYKHKAESLESRALYYENTPQREKQKALNIIQNKKEKQILKKLPIESALFAGIYPTGIYYADKRREINGDYLNIGHIFFSDLKYEIKENCPKDIKPLVEKDIQRIIGMRGQQYNISGCGQMVTLGYNLS